MGQGDWPDGGHGGVVAGTGLHTPEQPPQKAPAEPAAPTPVAPKSTGAPVPVNPAGESAAVQATFRGEQLNLSEAHCFQFTSGPWVSFGTDLIKHPAARVEIDIPTGAVREVTFTWMMPNTNGGCGHISPRPRR